MFVDEIKTEDGGTNRLPMPEISKNTCFCPSHGKRLRNKHTRETGMDSNHAASKLHMKIGSYIFDTTE
jgi:hypothetical protein